MFNKKSEQKFAWIFAVSTVLFLAAPAFTKLPNSKLLAQGSSVSQDLDAAMLYQLGVTRYNRQELETAEQAFRQALKIDKNIALARNYLGNIFMAKNNLDLAVQEYGEAVRINPDFAEAYYNLGLALQKQEKLENAIAAYRQALLINPTIADAHYNLGLIFYQQDLTQEAIAAYQEAIRLDAKNLNSYINLAIALQQEGDTEKAIANYRQVIKLNPENTLAYNNLGALLMLEDRTSEAIEVYREAINKNPQNATAYYNLGVILYNQGDLQLANQALKRARKEYYEQGNVRQAAKIEEMTQKITQALQPQTPQKDDTQTTPQMLPATTPNFNKEVNSDPDTVLPPPERIAPANSQ